jgi:hypothetical protein
MKRRSSIARIAWIALALALPLAGACSDANVAGNYTVALTNRADGCSIGWTSGEQATATFNVMQSGSDVTLTVNGLAAIFVGSVLGTSTFTGDVSGDELDLGVTGTVARSSGGCMYTINGKVSATQDGDTMSGRVEYRAATNDHADCGSRASCLSVQEFNATRPPPAE